MPVASAGRTDAWDILRSPVVTEKSVILKEDSTEEGSKRKQGQVLTFKVDKKATKTLRVNSGEHCLLER